jgi:hypothetical protein
MDKITTLNIKAYLIINGHEQPLYSPEDGHMYIFFDKESAKKFLNHLRYIAKKLKTKKKRRIVEIFLGGRWKNK